MADLIRDNAKAPDMPNTYTISITGAPLGNTSTGVIQQVSWKLAGTDGTYTASQSGTVDLPPIDPSSPQFVPLANVTVAVMLQWAGTLLNIPAIKAVIDADIAAQQATAAMAPLQLASAVAAQATAGVTI